MLSGLERPDSPPSDGSEARGAPSSPSNSWTSAETAQLPPEPAEESPAEQPKPKRCKISREQLAVLIKSFEEEPLPNFDQRQAIAKALGMTPRSVQIWFQNRRQRLKPQQAKAQGGGGRGGAAGGAAGGAYGSHPHYGMPGLAAAAHLCATFQADSAAAAARMGLSLPQAPYGMPPYDSGLMEPFAATKALLSAGYGAAAAASLGARLPGGAGAASSAGASSAGASSAPNSASCAAAAGPGAPASAAPAAANGAPQTDGLLLLLACADGASAPNDAGQPAAAAQEAPSVAAA